MKAYRIHKMGDPRDLRIDDLPSPSPGHGEVVVRVRAVSLNYRDLLVVKGFYNPKLKLPRIPTSDGAGEVIAVGEGVSRVKVGDRVIANFFPGWVDGEPTEAKFRTALGGAVDGMLAEEVALPAEALTPIPDGMTFEEASTLPCAALTAWRALIDLGQIKPGETILTQGTGGVSLFALQFARIAGARVIITSSSDEKLEKARKLGAHEGINYKSTPDWDERARELTGGVGVDHVVELGGAGTLPRSLKAVKAGGTISLIGVLTGGGEANPTPILMRSIRVQGIYVGPRRALDGLCAAATLHGLKPVIDRVFDFEQAADALAFMESGSHFGKLVIRV